jgi:hypothetical protein
MTKPIHCSYDAGSKSRLKEPYHVHMAVIQEISRKKGPGMNNFSQTRNTFQTLLTELELLQGPERVTHALRVVKQRETGKLCYQAEEDLTQEELSLLKDTLDLETSIWETYKQVCCENIQKRLR